MNQDFFNKRISEIEVEKGQIVAMINQYNNLMSQLQAQHNGLEGAKQECLRLIKKLNEEVKVTHEESNVSA